MGPGHVDQGQVGVGRGQVNVGWGQVMFIEVRWVLGRIR